MARLKKSSVIALIIAIAIIILIVWLAKRPSTLILKDGAVLSKELCSKINQVTIIHERGCPACAIALPNIRELEQELEMSFSYYDLAIDKDKEKILSLGLIPQAVPTEIINCKVYVGVRSKEEYREAILEK